MSFLNQIYGLVDSEVAVGSGEQLKMLFTNLLYDIIKLFIVIMKNVDDKNPGEFSFVISKFRKTLNTE